MRRARSKPTTKPSRQKGLTLSREQRFTALEAIDPSQLSPSVGCRSWSNVVSLLKQIEWRSGNGPCRAYVATFAASMNDRGGVSEDTVRRASKLAQKLGLLRVMAHVGRRGRESNEWRIDWDRVGALSRLDYNELGTPQPSKPPRPLDETFAAAGETSDPVTVATVPSRLSDRGTPQFAGGWSKNSADTNHLDLQSLSAGTSINLGREPGELGAAGTTCKEAAWPHLQPYHLAFV